MSWDGMGYNLSVQGATIKVLLGVQMIAIGVLHPRCLLERRFNVSINIVNDACWVSSRFTGPDHARDNHVDEPEVFGSSTTIQMS